jgi:hypothetical protein
MITLIDSIVRRECFLVARVNILKLDHGGLKPVERISPEEDIRIAPTLKAVSTGVHLLASKIACFMYVIEIDG